MDQMDKSVGGRRSFYTAKLIRVDVCHYNWGRPTEHKRPRILPTTVVREIGQRSVSMDLDC